MSISLDELRVERDRELTKLLESVRDRLTSDVHQFIADFIDNYEFALALEVIVDAFRETKQTFTRAELEYIETLARKMGMYGNILERLTRPSP